MNAAIRPTIFVWNEVSRLLRPGSNGESRVSLSSLSPLFSESLSTRRPPLSGHNDLLWLPSALRGDGCMPACRAPERTPTR